LGRQGHDLKKSKEGGYQSAKNEATVKRYRCDLKKRKPNGSKVGRPAKGHRKEWEKLPVQVLGGDTLQEISQIENVFAVNGLF